LTDTHLTASFPGKAVLNFNETRDDGVVVASAGWLEFNVPCQHKYGYIRDNWHQLGMQIICTLRALHHSTFYRLDALADARPTCQSTEGKC